MNVRTYDSMATTKIHKNSKSTKKLNAVNVDSLASAGKLRPPTTEALMFSDGFNAFYTYTVILKHIFCYTVGCKREKKERERTDRPNMCVLYLCMCITESMF